MTAQNNGQGAPKVQGAIELIRQVLSAGRGQEKGREFLWQDIASAMSDLCSAQTPQAEEILTQLLEFKGKIPLSVESHLTSVMSPEDTLQSIAIRQLSEWTGPKHLAKFKRVRAATSSPTLRSIAQREIDRHSRHVKSVRTGKQRKG